ncbi:homoserine dehydrogenase [Desulfuromonas acetoxidans]|uniref:Homoserine dehydrogenase n=1 Tax=Desulfuromonas acetoxidans (strain DSM 684 / 11070) TaxID=281689 RepID=Q1K0M5_DESA6|nr:homoserine dehydrogenase [Desulfuromonas acetoxidans]EAT15916.1 Homoserine dehydrogenase [Desulfuromonas acetoxidans DSM 684]MBF0644186.1 homoserine dehydrogenase [Desulfuromonas acetoxidans]NVD24516.1 homoserine dehydrogenase [Desulfuromonas acetoxidans]NVE16534.1 homoserine dehydrogenase [Desulfuromonas acetoxidans]
MKEIKVGLLGFGTIGTGVVKVIQQNAEVISQRLGTKLTLAAIADRDITTDRGVVLEPGVLTDDADHVLTNPDIDVVIELIGGYEPARTFVLKALENGKHVVTANKALLALYGQELMLAAEKNNVSLLFEAAVGGGIPILSSIRENLCANQFSDVFGILNGTCNYILTRMTENGEDFSDVLADAQELGYAEADPTFDIEGIDTAHKLSILMTMCFGTWVDFDSIYTEGITRITALDIQYARQFGYQIKLLAIGKQEDGVVEARVHPTMIPDTYSLAEVRGVLNAVRLIGDFVGPVTQVGSGAGMDATASAVLGDVMSLSRQMLGESSFLPPALNYLTKNITTLPVRAMEDITSPYYVRVMVEDRPGVLAKIAATLGEYNISISSMIQPERELGGCVPIVLMTHDAVESDVRAALEKIDQLDICREASLFIRIENDLA